MRESIKRKQEEVKLLSGKIKESISSVAFEYPGLSVAEFTELRTLLRDSGCDAKVVKNNISKRASEMAGYNNFASVFKGPKAIAFSSGDEIAAAKIINEYSKKHEKLVISGSIIGGVFFDAEKTKDIALTPSREVLLAQIGAGLLHPLLELSIGLNLIEK